MPQTFQQFLTTQSVQIPLIGFVVNLVLVGILSLILSCVYVRFGDSLSNRRILASSFVLIALTTMLIITIVKSSLALSLGLVGALSIVRFRAAIKEPEELSYLFLAIAIGLGFGADQRLVTTIAFVIITIVIVGRSYLGKSEDKKNLLLTISSRNPGKALLEEIVNVLKGHCSSVNLRRFNEVEGTLESSFLVEFDEFSQLNQCKIELQKLDNHIQIMFLENIGIM